MTLKQRLESIERKAGIKEHFGPEIILLCAVGFDGEHESQSNLRSAIFVGFEHEYLHSLDRETDDEFGARAEYHLAGLKLEKK